MYKFFFVRWDLDLGVMDVAIQTNIGKRDLRNLCKLDMEHVYCFERKIERFLLRISLPWRGGTATTAPLSPFAMFSSLAPWSASNPQSSLAPRPLLATHAGARTNRIRLIPVWRRKRNGFVSLDARNEDVLWIHR